MAENEIEEDFLIRSLLNTDKARRVVRRRACAFIREHIDLKCFNGNYIIKHRSRRGCLGDYTSRGLAIYIKLINKELEGV